MWHRCAQGMWWGRHGAAGLAILSPKTARPRLLLQRRALWTHSGGTWGLPGGALARHESPLEGALRETAEEGVLLPGGGEVVDTHVHEACDHWSYTTLLWRPGGAVSTRVTGEAPEYRWLDASEVGAVPLHPAVSAMLDRTGWLAGG